jgi:hypothetical protein
MTTITARTNILTTTIACAIGLTLADAAAAQTPAAPAPSTRNVFNPGHWTVTPFIGVGFSGDVDSATGALGAAAGYVWSDRMSFEGEFNVLPSSEANGVIEVGTRVWSLTGNVLYHFNGRTVVPYGVVGIGFGHTSADLKNSTLTSLDTSSTEFVLNFGGGVERRWTERLAVRGDLRYFFGGDLVPDYWRLSGGVTFDIGRR